MGEVEDCAGVDWVALWEAEEMRLVGARVDAAEDGEEDDEVVLAAGVELAARVELPADEELGDWAAAAATEVLFVSAAGVLLLSAAGVDDAGTRSACALPLRAGSAVPATWGDD